jgi:hypothetical protein
MIKYTVASAMMVLSIEENRILMTPEHAKKAIITNAEMSDMTHREWLAVTTGELNNSPNATPIAYGVIRRCAGEVAVHNLNASIGMSGSGTTNAPHERSVRRSHT